MRKLGFPLRGRRDSDTSHLPQPRLLNHAYTQKNFRAGMEFITAKPSNYLRAHLQS